jgi:hypothetical protein
MSLKSGVCSSVLLSVAFAAIAAFKAWLVVFGQSTTALMVLSFVLPLHSILFFFTISTVAGATLPALDASSP